MQRDIIATVMIHWYRVLIAVLDYVLLMSCTCLPKRYKGMEDNEIIYNCFRSNNYLSDVRKMDNTRDKIYLVFDTSRIPKITNNSFEPLGEHLNILGIIHSGVRDVEDRAFYSLTKLRILNLEKNELKAVKPSWFDDLYELRELSLADNDIGFLDPAVFLKTSLLEKFDISTNQMDCLDVEKLNKWTHLTTVTLFPNPYNIFCGCNVIHWQRKHENIIKTPLSDSFIADTINFYYNCANGTFYDHLEEDTLTTNWTEIPNTVNEN